MSSTLVRRRRQENAEPSLLKSEKPIKPDHPEMRCIRVLIVLATLFVACIAYAYKTSPISAQVIDDIPAENLDWNYGYNFDLQRGRRLHEDLLCPESSAYDEEGNVYSGLADGRIVKITPLEHDNIGTETSSVSVINHGNNDPKAKRSRPLGLRYKNNFLYVADGNRGIYRIDLRNNSLDMMVRSDAVDPPMKLADDLVLSENGDTVYFTDADYRWGVDMIAHSYFEAACSARLFRLDVKTRKVVTLLSGLCFANGVELNEDETKILVSETQRFRIRVIDLKTLEIEKTVLLAGGPDNIRTSSKGGYWVAVTSMYDPTLKFILKFPFLRNVLASILGEEGLFKFANLQQGIVAEVDKEFNVVRVLYDLEGKLSRAITQVTEMQNGKLLLTSFSENGMVEISP